MKLIRLAFVLKHEAAQARVLMLKRNPEVCVLKNCTTIAFGRDCEIWGWNTTSAFNKWREVRIWVETWPSRLAWGYVWGWNVTSASARFASEALSLVIFRQPIKLPLKFSKLCSWLEWISKYFALYVDLGFRDWTGNLLKCPELDLV